MDSLKWISIAAISLFSCMPKPSLEGTYELYNSEGCNRNFLKLEHWTFPMVRQPPKIYFRDGIFINPPYVKNGKPLFCMYNRSYKKIELCEIGKIDMRIDGDKLFLSKEGCILEFRKSRDFDHFSENSLYTIKLEMFDYDLNFIGSEEWIRTDSTEHLFKLAEAIGIQHMDRVHDEGLADGTEYCLTFSDNFDNEYRTVSFNSIHTPYEIHILLRYLMYDLYPKNLKAKHLRY